MQKIKLEFIVSLSFHHSFNTISRYTTGIERKLTYLKGEIDYE